MSPLGKIPAFRDGDRTLCDSSVISQYLERTHPEHPMFPQDPYEYARTLWLEEYSDTALVEVVGGKIFFPRVVAKMLMGKEPDEAAIQKAIDQDLPPRLDYLESQLGDGPYLVGDRFTVADVAVTSVLLNLRHSGVAIDPARWPKLAKYVSTHLERPSFAKLIPEEKGFLGQA
jgi:glutathione S-transferase